MTLGILPLVAPRPVQACSPGAGVVLPLESSVRARADGNALVRMAAGVFPVVFSALYRCSRKWGGGGGGGGGGCCAATYGPALAQMSAPLAVCCYRCPHVLSKRAETAPLPEQQEVLSPCFRCWYRRSRRRGRGGVGGAVTCGCETRGSPETQVCPHCPLCSTAVWFQTQLILTACQIHYHGHCGVTVALDSSEP